MFFPRPFCSLTKAGIQEVDEFAEHFGKPKLEIVTTNGVVKKIKVKRTSPCGSTLYMAKGLLGTSITEAPQRGSLLVQTYPCMASPRIERSTHDSLIHIAGYIVKKAIANALDRSKKISIHSL